MDREASRGETPAGRYAPSRRRVARAVAALVALLAIGFWVHAERKREQAESERARAEAERARVDAEARARAEADGMVWVPGGEFFFGCNEAVDQACDRGEQPGRIETLPGFAIDKTEVTVAQYRACVAAGGCSDERLAIAFWGGGERPTWSQYCNWPKPERGNHPINCVDWKQATAYCRWAGKRLPTEMEWEKAARGTDGRKYPWGNVEYEFAGRVANIADVHTRVLHPEWNIPRGYDDGYLDTAPVGSFPAGKTVYGGLDMMGNVWEFAADEFGQGYSIRGGSWNNVARGARASDHRRVEFAYRSPLIGFRCIR
jgi:formylglycine-generating enzyme required for sulfatase activity